MSQHGVVSGRDREATRRSLRLVWITDGCADEAKILAVARAAIAGGLRAIQLREPGLSSRRLWRLGECLHELLMAEQGLLIVNDRIELAVAGVAKAVHLGGQSMPWAQARAILPANCRLGCSAHNAAELKLAAAANADYASLSPVFATGCKPGATALGVEQAMALSDACPIPVVWLGGLDAARLRGLETMPFGIAVRSALSEAADPKAVAAELMALISVSGEPSIS